MYLWIKPTATEYKISVPEGDIVGATDVTVYGQQYFRFEGIPYAKPPINELRFMAPEPPDPWGNCLDCKKPGNKPLQLNEATGEVEGSEDCLYLNIYSKYYYCPKLLPVLVFIYGGSFQIGEATRDLYGPDYFMDKDCVLVTFNYRLGCLGFLSLKNQSLDVPGNMGIRDQIMALQWIKNNIILFNGDFENVTVFGMSAGSACLHYLMASNLSRGLFHRAILMSGSILNYWANMPQQNFAFRLARLNGFQGGDDEELIFRFLKSLPGSALVNYKNFLTSKEMAYGYIFPFGPVVEPYGDKNTAVIWDDPLEMLRKSWGNNITIMLGSTSFEGLVSYPWIKKHPDIIKKIQENTVLLLPPDVRRMLSEEHASRLTQKLLQKHFGNEPITEDKFKFMDMMSYRIILLGVHRTLLSRAFRAQKPTFLYRFDYDSPEFNQQRKKLCGSDAIRGVAHGDELSYLFYAKTAWKLEPHSPEKEIINRMVSIWYSFATYGKPDCEEIGSIDWKPFRSDRIYQALNIGSEVDYMEIPERDKMEAWGQCYEPEVLF